MKNVGIISVGSFVPEKVLTNFDLEKMVETSDEWITTRTGIKERRIAAKGERNSHLAIKAAQSALKHAAFDPKKLDLIIVATISPDSNFPSVACLVQKELGAVNAAAFDVSAACAGFLFALITAKQYIASGMYKNALVIASEKISSLIDWSDRNTCVLFGDGAGACLLSEVESDRGIVAEYLHSQGEHNELMQVISEDRESLSTINKTMAIPYVLMQGQELFKIAVNSMADAVEIAVKKAGLQLSDIDCVVPHQANDRIISAVAKKLDVPKEKIFVNIDRYGNMSAASIAVALYEAVEHKQIKKGSNVVLVAFGAGLVTAACVVRW
jgi:3-oxoacyl-[acyl-carrier-protein] synthase-3